MKKDAVITTRVPAEIKAIIQFLADQDERDLAWMLRKLLTEALEARGLINKEKSS